MGGVTVSGSLVRRYGGRTVIGTGAALVVAGLLVVAGATGLPLTAGVLCAGRPCSASA
ncbi:hypothetical protein GCM10010207_64280 [Streptomyces atratus]|nr:hypothetical protein GCM10010207_64280 [Streptomyces atratus]